MQALARLTPNKQQERQSRHQLSEQLEQFGWLVTPPSEDLGEDFLVHIYYDGRATGVIFHIQAKSITNLYQRHKGNFLPYPFETKDLKHWEEFHLPVVLLVWDTHLQEGRWVLARNAINKLDTTKPTWRQQKTVQVAIPWSNDSSEKGLLRLQSEIGHVLYPLLFQNKSPNLNITFSFPQTEEGQEQLSALEKHITEGTPAKISGEFIEKLTVSESAKPWLIELETIAKSSGQILLGPPTSPDPFPVQMKIVTQDGQTAYLSIELKVTKSGSHKRTFSNQHQKTPLHFIFTFQIDKDKFTSTEVEIHLNEAKYPTQIIYDFVHFERLWEVGGEFSLTFVSQNYVTLKTTLPTRQNLVQDAYINLIGKLLKIQSAFNRSFELSSLEIDGKNVQAINKLASIIDRGIYTTYYSSATIPFSVKPEFWSHIGSKQEKSPSLSFGMSYDESSVTLFDEEIMLGTMTRYITGKVDSDTLYKSQGDHSENPLLLKLTDVTQTEIFPNWFQKEAKRLGICLGERFRAESIYLFGSVAWGEAFAPETDIDFAVKGIPSDRFWEAINWLESQTHFRFDLADIDTLPTHLQERIMAQGILVYGQAQTETANH